MPRCIENVNKLLEKLAAGGFARHVATLASGAVLAQLLPLLFAPLLTRLYTPADFGLLTLFVVWLSSLAVLATARYELAIVLPEREEDAANLLALSLLIATVFALLLLLLVPLLQLLPYQQIDRLGNCLYLLPLSVWLAGLMQAWTSWNNRRQHYAGNASGRMAQSLATVVVQAGTGLVGVQQVGLVAGQFVGQLASLCAQGWHDARATFAWRRHCHWPQMRVLAQRYRDFPRLNAPQALIASLQDLLLISLLTVLGGSIVVGLYGMMMRVLKLPAAMVGQAVAQVAYRDMAAAHAAGHPLRPLLKKTVLLLGLLALPPFGLIALYGDTLFALVFGEAWREAGRYAQMLSPYILFHFIASPLGLVPLVVSRQRETFVFTVAGTVLPLMAVWSAYQLWGNWAAAFGLLSAVMVAHFSVYFVWLWRVTR